MPLQDHFPVIDDRSYASLVDEVRARIPRYTPEWTNFNESDPGIVLTQLFAWMTELQLYRLSKVPELHYLKFLELLGVELEPAQAASAKLTLQVAAGFNQPSIIVPAKTQFSSAEPDAEGRIVFELDRAATLIRAKLVNLLAYDGFAFRDLTNDNLDTSVSFQPFGPAATRDHSFVLGFDEELPEVSFVFSAWKPQSQRGVVVTRCASAAVPRSGALLAWEFWNGREWAALTLLKDETASLTQNGDVLLRGPKLGTMASRTFGALTIPRFWIRARIQNAGFEEAPRLLAVRVNTAAVTQAETWEYEAVGGSTGEVDQILRLRNTPVLPASLLLEVDEGDGFQAWTEVPDFFGSGPDDAHYVLNRATGEIRFSDGKQGRVPVANANNHANVRALRYRAGGGKRGNVTAGAITRLLDSVRGLDANAVTNPFGAGGGRDEQSVQDAVRHAPQVLKNHDRAVTAEDYEALALRAANIARALALPLHHPDYPGIEVPGTVTVLVVPDVEGEAPTPNEQTLQAVCSFLNKRRQLTTELYVTSPKYQRVVVHAELVADDTADLAELKANALDSLNLYFHAIAGGESSDPTRAVEDPRRSGGGWPFGGDIYYSLLYRRLLFRGVKRLVSLRIELDGELYPECRDVALPAGMLLASGEHQVTVNYEVPA